MNIQVDSRTDQVVCRSCGRTATDAGQCLGWCRQRDRRGESWLCGDCTRDEIRSIEVGFDGP
jgi:hypothetical protein